MAEKAHSLYGILWFRDEAMLFISQLRQFIFNTTCVRNSLLVPKERWKACKLHFYPWRKKTLRDYKSHKTKRERGLKWLRQIKRKLPPSWSKPYSGTLAAPYHTALAHCVMAVITTETSLKLRGKENFVHSLKHISTEAVRSKMPFLRHFPSQKGYDPNKQTIWDRCGNS